MGNTTGLDDPQDTGVDTPNEQDSSTTPNDNPQDSGASELEKLRAALKERNAEAKAHREAKEKAQAELDRIRQETLEKQGEYKKLYEDAIAKNVNLTAEAEKAERLEAAVIASNEQRAQQIPDTYRSLVPDLPPEAKSAWLDENLPKLVRQPIPDLNGGAGGSGGKPPKSNVTEQDKRAANIAQNYGITLDPEKIAARRESLDNE